MIMMMIIMIPDGNENSNSSCLPIKRGVWRAQHDMNASMNNPDDNNNNNNATTAAADDDDDDTYGY